MLLHKLVRQKNHCVNLFFLMVESRADSSVQKFLIRKYMRENYKLEVIEKAVAMVR